MQRGMKKTYWTFSTFLIGILLISISCDDNSRSLGDFRIDIATVVPEGDNAYSLLLDNGKRLWPAATAVWYKPSYNQRVFLNYTILSEKMGEFDHYIKVNDIWNILTKEAIELTAQNEDSVGYDPVRINHIWVGGDYLNVSFMFNYGGEQPHAINLIKNSLSPYTDLDKVPLEFRHNSYNSSNDKTLYEGFVCFDLKPTRVDDADSVNISIEVKEWVVNNMDEVENKKYDVVYRYNQPVVSAHTEMPIPVISSDEYY